MSTWKIVCYLHCTYIIRVVYYSVPFGGKNGLHVTYDILMYVLYIAQFGWHVFGFMGYMSIIIATILL